LLTKASLFHGFDHDVFDGIIGGQSVSNAQQAKDAKEREDDVLKLHVDSPVHKQNAV
jgi:hypothetical protein